MVDAARRELARADRVLAADARAWGVPLWSRWWLVGLPLVGAVILVGLAPFREPYHFIVDEDHVVEWAQFATILAASVVFLVTARAAGAAGRRGLGILFVLVAVASLIVAGEEISWGQRLLGLETPDALEEINHQGETNINNITIVQRLFNIAALLAGAYGFFLPVLWLVASIREPLGRVVDRLLVPPLAFGSLFFLPFAYRAFRALLLPEAGNRITEYGEWPELTLYVGILLMGIVIWRALRRPATDRPA